MEPRNVKPTAVGSRECGVAHVVSPLIDLADGRFKSTAVVLPCGSYQTLTSKQVGRWRRQTAICSSRVSCRICYVYRCMMRPGDKTRKWKVGVFVCHARCRASCRIFVVEHEEHNNTGTLREQTPCTTQASEEPKSVYGACQERTQGHPKELWGLGGGRYFNMRACGIKT